MADLGGVELFISYGRLWIEHPEMAAVMHGLGVASLGAFSLAADNLLSAWREIEIEAKGKLKGKNES